MIRRDFLQVTAGASALSLGVSCATRSNYRMNADRTVPPPLQPGDTVACICPGSPVKPEAIQPSAAYLERCGYRVRFGDHMLKNYLCGMSGTDEERLDDLNRFIRDPDVNAIFALRGGYGTHRLLPGVDFDALRKNPKWITGYSDVTTLHLAIYLRTGLPSLHGPVIAYDFGYSKPTEFLERSWWDALLGSQRGEEASFVKYSNWEPRERLATWVSGVGEGVLLGGNLSRLAALAGTPFALPQNEDVVLFMEEVDEAAYRVDRFITQLRESGAFRNVKGIMVGECLPPEDEPDEIPLIRDVLRDRLTDLGIPVLYGVPIGHYRYNMTVVNGARVRLDTDRMTMRYV